jgi:hypothetical protein
LDEFRMTDLENPTTGRVDAEGPKWLGEHAAHDHPGRHHWVVSFILGGNICLLGEHRSVGSIPECGSALDFGQFNSATASTDMAPSARALVGSSPGDRDGPAEGRSMSTIDSA